MGQWTKDSADADFRVVCSQTIFCKATTHAGATFRRSVADLDCGGWPQKARNRALRILQGAPDAVMLHGDQHTGAPRPPRRRRLGGLGPRFYGSRHVQRFPRAPGGPKRRARTVTTELLSGPAVTRMASATA